MPTKISSEDTHQAWLERNSENRRQLLENRLYCAHLDSAGAHEAWEAYRHAINRTITIGEQP